MEAFLVSAGLVAIAEIGDKTQLLAMILAARYRKPVPIILGILVATLVNHAVAASVGAAVAAYVGPQIMRWIVGGLFIVMAGWCLIPDKADEGPKAVGTLGAFFATVVAFFLVEMGDKTQIATVALAARFQNVLHGHRRHHGRHAAGQRAGRAVRRRADQAHLRSSGCGSAPPPRSSYWACSPWRWARW